MKAKFILLLLPAFVACKKNYTCYCGDWNSNTKTPVFEIKDTKKNADKKCSAYRNAQIAIPEYTCNIN